LDSVSGDGYSTDYDQLAGYENELDWSSCRPALVYKYVEHLRRAGADSPQRVELFEITNRAFFERLVKYFSDRKEANEKYKAPEGSFAAFTLD